jgi:hypothetical protein
LALRVGLSRRNNARHVAALRAVPSLELLNSESCGPSPRAWPTKDAIFYLCLMELAAEWRIDW